MLCTRTCAVGESRWTVVVPGTRWRNWEILLLREVARTVFMVVNRRSFAGLRSTRWMRVACRAVLMLSLMAIVEVVRGEPSLLMKSVRSWRVRPFLVEGVLGVSEERGAAATAGFADGSVVFFLGFLTTCALEGLRIRTGGGVGGGAGGGGGVSLGVDPEAFGGAPGVWRISYFTSVRFVCKYSTISARA